MSRKMSGKMQRELPAQLGTGDDMPHEKGRKEQGRFCLDAAETCAFLPF